LLLKLVDIFCNLFVIFFVIFITFLLAAKLELDIEEYSFSQTTLEQVFLKFSHYDEGNSVEWWFTVLMCRNYVIIGDKFAISARTKNYSFAESKASKEVRSKNGF